VTFQGYRRSDGQAGIRNHILVMPTVICANQVATAIAEGLPAVAIPHVYGCSFDGRDNAALEYTLVGVGRNPNVAAVLVVTLGCETASGEKVVEGIAGSGKPVARVDIQEEGGTPRAIAHGREIVEGFAREIERLRPEPVPVEELILAVECGASDAFSGLSANPAVGAAADLLVEAGGTVILSETSEIIGAEQILARRCVDAETRERLLNIVEQQESAFRSFEEHAGGVYIAPGNIAGGLTTLEEKSLGCIRKGGTSPVREVVAFGERPSRRGLVVMDTPGHDVASMIGMVAGGAQVICFTTGRGTPTGCPVAPVIKVCSNTETSRHMADNIDLDAGTILSGEENIEEVGQRIYERVLAVANGERTCSELLGHAEFMIGRRREIGACPRG
jgi:altronate dehydratase large subunit